MKDELWDTGKWSEETLRTLHDWISPISGAFIKWGRGRWVDGEGELNNADEKEAHTGQKRRWKNRQEAKQTLKYREKKKKN